MNENTEERETLDFKAFARRPFTLNAVMITEENIEEVAKYIGKSGTKQDGTPYIQVDPTKVRGLYRAYPGFWLTKVGEHVRCYSKRAFARQFVEMTEDVATIVAHLAPTEDSQDS